jgi:Regulatory P domain of the subtilisin-like proprotein convertases and other proteases
MLKIKRLSICMLLLISLNLSPLSMLGQDAVSEKLKKNEAESSDGKGAFLPMPGRLQDFLLPPPAKFYAAPQVAIPDGGYIGILDGNDGFGTDAGMVCSTINVSNLPPSAVVADVSVDLRLSHTWIGDLTAKLQSPNGTILTIINRPGSNVPDDGSDSQLGDSSNMNGTFIAYRDGGANVETMGSTIGTSQNVCNDDGICIYAPTPDTATQPPSKFADFIGQPAAGNWTLCVSDGSSLDTGTFHAWTLNLVPAINAVFTPNTILGIPDDGYTGGFDISGQQLCTTLNTTTAGVPAGILANGIFLDVDLRHTWVGDLTIKLRSPSGTILTVLNRPGSNAPDNGGGAVGDDSNWDGVLTFRDGGGPEAETMGSGLGSEQVVCQDNGICVYDPSPDTAVQPPSSFANFNGEPVAGNWTLCIGDSTFGDEGFLRSWSLKFPIPFAPTAAGATVSGRLMTTSGAPVRGGIIKMTNSAGVEKIARSNPFGYFHFTDVSTGETYVITVESKLYRFTPQTVSVMSDIAELNIMALPD